MPRLTSCIAGSDLEALPSKFCIQEASVQKPRPAPLWSLRRISLLASVLSESARDMVYKGSITNFEIILRISGHFGGWYHCETSARRFVLNANAIFKEAPKKRLNQRNG